MSRFLALDTRAARWDRLRDALVIPAAGTEVVVTLGALRSICGWQVDEDDAADAANDERATLVSICNTLVAQDGVVTVTAGIANSRDWSLRAADDEHDDRLVDAQTGEIL